MTEDWIEEILSQSTPVVKTIPVLETFNDKQILHDSNKETLNNLNPQLLQETVIQRTLKVVDKRAQNATLSEDFHQTKTKETIGTRQTSFKETLTIHFEQVSNLLSAFA